MLGEAGPECVTVMNGWGEDNGFLDLHTRFLVEMPHRCISSRFLHAHAAHVFIRHHLSFPMSVPKILLIVYLIWLQE